MLTKLSVENYALIDKSVIEFENGFSVITGETGAGKSIILGALNMLIGQRTDSKIIKNPEKKCVVEGIFNIQGYNLQDLFEENDLDYDNECIIRRELSANGKSRAFINDTPATVSVLKTLGEKLIDIHSQHQNLLLNDAMFQLEVVDVIAENTERVRLFKSEFANYKKEASSLEKLKAEAAKAESDREFAEFQLKQLKDADLDNCSQENLEEELKTLSNAESIKEALSNALYLLDKGEQNINKNLKDVHNAVNSIKESFSKAEDISERIYGCLVELKDIVRDLDVMNNDIENDPQKLEFLTSRLDELYTLQRKHNVKSTDELIAIRDNFEERLNKMDSYAEDIEEKEKLVNKLFTALETEAEEISNIRKSKTDFIEKELVSLLKNLGMPNAKIKVEIKASDEITANGKDIVSFLFSANKDTQLQQIASIASGGEISRVMLSLKSVLAKLSCLPTIIFDEIDTGVSGDIADRMGNIMKEMGTDMQVLSITHLPQIASKGSVHYKVFKKDVNDTTVSNIKKLTNEERITEVAQMVSGSNLTEAAIENAKVLLGWQ